MIDNNGHRRSSILRLAAAALLYCLCVQSGEAQGPASGSGSDRRLFTTASSITFGAGIHAWHVADAGQLIEGTYPLTIAIPASERTLVTIMAVPASVSGSGASITGVPETRIGGSYVVPGEKWWLSGAVSMPTGATRLSQAQTDLAETIAQPALGYPIPSMGHGLNTSWGCAYATSVSRLIVFGFGAALSTKGSYEPVAPSSTASVRYAPGNELSANIGIDWRDGLKVDRLSADYTVTYYLADELNGARFFQSGTKAALVLAGTHTGSMMTQTLRLRLEMRARNVSFVDGREEQSPSARMADAAYAATMPLREKLQLTLGAELRTMTSDEFPVNGEIIATGGGTVGTVSAECSYAASVWCIVTPRASLGIGSVTVVNSRRHASGFDAGIGVKFLL